MQKGNEKDVIFALIHADNSVEIMLREHLRFDKNKPWKDLENKGFNQLLDECRELATIENNKSQFVAFHDIRNALYHVGTFVPRKQDVESAVYFAKLLFNEIHPNSTFKDMKLASPSDRTINILAKEFGKQKPYVTEMKFVGELASFFRRHGYKTEFNPKFAGTTAMADLLVTGKDEIIIVEVKARTKGKRVLNSAVFQLAGFVEVVKKALPEKKVTGWLVTNTAFSKAAVSAARKLKIKVVSSEEFRDMLSRNSSYLY
jgi:hypothetical protein